MDPALGLVSATQGVTAPPNVLPPIDSPAMKSALEVCGEIFPGSAVDIEVMSDPEDPARAWYCLTVKWAGGVRDYVDRTSRWYDRFETMHRNAILDFVISVVPV
jgi:hypothetical protein